jgi:hypothetical protein
MTPREEVVPWWRTVASPGGRTTTQLIEIRRRTLDEFDRAPDQREPVPNAPDPVVVDILSGASVRELAQARDGLERARYQHAVRAGRDAGLSWGEIGGVLGVPKQLLHHRFRRRSLEG